MIWKRVLLLVLFFVGVFFLPWERVDWGKFRMSVERTITVSGMAKMQQRNQIARFTVGAEETGSSKSAVVNKVNASMEEVISLVKQFGVEEKDIKTQRMSVNEFTDWRDNVKKWRASNSVEVILREVDRASALADLLNESVATRVYGPNLSVDDTSEAEAELLGRAVEKAREKAELLLEASGEDLGGIVSITEGVSTSIRPLSMMEIGGDEVGLRAPVEVGSTEISKTVTVVFEIK